MKYAIGPLFHGYIDPLSQSWGSAVDNLLIGLSVSTRRAYASDLAHLFSWCDSRGLNNARHLAARHIFAYLVDVRRDGRSTSTIRRRLTALRKIASSHLLDLPVSELVRLEKRFLDAHPGQASVLVVSDDPIIRAGLQAVLTESGAVCWADETAHLEPTSASSWDYILVWMNSPRGIDPFGAISRIRALGTAVTTRIPVVAVHSSPLNPIVQLRLAEAGVRYALPHQWLSENLPALADMLAEANVPLKFHLDTPLALRQRIGLRLSGEIEALLDAAALAPDKLWKGHLPQSHLPIARSEITRLRRIALEQAGIPAPEFGKYASSLRRAPDTPEWPRVRDIVRQAFGVID